MIKNCYNIIVHIYLFQSYFWIATGPQQHCPYSVPLADDVTATTIFVESPRPLQCKHRIRRPGHVTIGYHVICFRNIIFSPRKRDKKRNVPIILVTDKTKIEDLWKIWMIRPWPPRLSFTVRFSFFLITCFVFGLTVANRVFHCFVHRTRFDLVSDNFLT